MYEEMNTTNLINNLYTLSRYFRAAESKPMYYGTDILLYPNEAYTLRAIAEEPGISQTDISQKMHRTKGATSVVVQKLIQKGLAVSRNESFDQRVGNLYVSEKGQEVYKQHLDFDRRYVEMLSSELELTSEQLHLVNETIVHFMELGKKRREEKKEDFI